MTEKRTITLKTKHLFKILDIAKKTGFTKQAKVLFTGIDAKGLTEEEALAKQQSITGDLLVSVIENLDKVEQEVYELLADLTDKTAQEIEDQPIGETFSAIKETFASEDLLGFLSSATV